MDVNDDDFCAGFFASIMVLFEVYLVYMRKIKEHKPKSLLSKKSRKIPEHYKTGTLIFVRKTLKTCEIWNLVGPWNGPLKECAISSRFSLDTHASNPCFRGDSHTKSALVYEFRILTH